MFHSELKTSFFDEIFEQLSSSSYRGRSIYLSKGDRYVYSVDVPGCGAEDVDVSTKDGILLVKLKYRGASTSAKCLLDQQVDVSDVRATVDKGVLDISFGLKKTNSSNKISVTSR